MLAQTGFASPASARWTAEAEYGLHLPGSFLGSPRFAFSQGSGEKDYTLGWQLKSLSAERDLSLELTMNRRQSVQSEPSHRFGAQIAWRLSRERGDPLDLSLDLRAEQAYEAGRAADGQVGATIAITW